MRKAIGLALGLVLAVGSAAQAQSQRRGFFGYEPSLSGTTPATTGAAAMPIPSRTMNTGFKLTDLIPRFNSPIGKPVYARTTLPTYSPLMSQDYLKAFGYIPPKPIGLGTASKRFFWQ